MTIDEAISHALEVAENCEEQAKQCDIDDRYERHVMHENAKCAADHRQLAEWLTELKDLREENKVLISECDRLIKEKCELLSKVSGGDVLRICQLEEQLQVELDNSHCLEIELKEAKRLLKAAVEDMHIEDMCDVCIERIPNSPIHCPDGSNCFIWRYKDEALKLIGEDVNEI